MNANTITEGILKAVGAIVGIVLLCWGLYQLRNVLLYLILAAILTLISEPMVQFLTGKELSFY